MSKKEGQSDVRGHLEQGKSLRLKRDKSFQTCEAPSVSIESMQGIEAISCHEA